MGREIFNLEAEQLVLRSIIKDGTLEGLEGANLKPEDYFIESHRVVYIAILKLYKENREIDIINLAEELRNDPEILQTAKKIKIKYICEFKSWQ